MWRTRGLLRARLRLLHAARAANPRGWAGWWPDASALRLPSMRKTKQRLLISRDVRPIRFPWQAAPGVLALKLGQEHPSEIVSRIDRVEAMRRAVQLPIDDVEEGEGRTPPCLSLRI